MRSESVQGAQPGMRVALKDAMDYLRALVHPQDREAFSLVLTEGRQGEKARREPRVLRVPGPTGQNQYYAVRFISLTEESGLLCGRDVTGQTRLERKQKDSTSVENVARLLRTRICADADFTEIFDIATGRRIRSGADLDPLALSNVESLEDFFRRLEADIHPADRPQLIACAADVLALDPETATFWDVRHVWRVRMGERNGEPMWRWHETTFLYMPDEEPESGALYILSRDNNDALHPHPEQEDLAHRFPEILSQHDMEAYCANREANPRTGRKRITYACWRRTRSMGCPWSSRTRSSCGCRRSLTGRPRETGSPPGSTKRPSSSAARTWRIRRLCGSMPRP